MNSLNKHWVLLSFTRMSGLILVFLTLCNSFSFSQLTDKETAGLHEKNFCEELYVKTDRDLYIAGETVWLKIYKLNGLNHTPGNISKVAYTDLLDLENNPVVELKTGIDGNSGSGNFLLPDTLRTGNYILRSYTNWMQNFSKSLFSYKSITVINPFENIGNIRVPSRSLIPDSVVFFPEGGHLIAGIETRLGFRCTDKNGNPVIMKGAFINQNNDTIGNTKTEKNGFGWISIKPAGQGKISLVILNKERIIKKFALPDIQKEGVTFSAVKKDGNSTTLLRIFTNSGSVFSGNKLYLILNSAGLISIKKEFNFGNDNEIDISGKDLPEGISHLSIVDDHDNILAERWINNESKNELHYNIKTQKNTFSRREKIKIEVSATDNNGVPAESDFSISVVKVVTLNKNSFDDNKYRQLPDLATIKSDNYSPDINDYLLFYGSHEPVINYGKNTNGTPLYLPELEGHLISGNIKDRKSGEPLKNENITLSFVGKVALCQFTKTNDQGDFNFLTTEHGLKEIVIQPLSQDIKDCWIDLNNPFNTTFTNYSHLPFYLDSSGVGSINNVIISTQINDIYEPYHKRPVKNTGFGSSPNFYGKPDNEILIEKYIELTSLKEVVKELIPGVTAYKSGGKTKFRLTRKYQSQPVAKNPLVLVDGVPYNDIDKILAINSKEVERIDVLIAKYYISDNVLDGILHFVTKKGNLGALDLDRSVFRQEYELPENKKEFYTPDYSVDSLKNDRLPDYRNTLYWNPSLCTDKTGKATAEFYSSDESADYIITVEGIAQDGKAGVASIPLTVRK